MSAKVEPALDPANGARPRAPTGKKKVNKDLLDVYVLVDLLSDKARPVRTQTISDAGRNHLVTKEQALGQSLKFDSSQVGAGDVEVKVYDDDELSGDDLVGTFRGNLLQVLEGSPEHAQRTAVNADGSVNFRMRLEYGDNHAFAGNVDTLLSRTAEGGIEVQFVKFLELRDVGTVTDLRGLVDMVPVYVAIGILVLYYIVGCVFFGLYPMALRNNDTSDVTENYCLGGSVTQRVVGTSSNLQTDDLLATCDQSLNDGSSSDCWGFVDAFYFTTATLTTVGYGDMGPGDPGARGFALVFALVGTAFVGVALGIISGFLMDKQEAAEEELKRKGGPKEPTPQQKKCKKDCPCLFASSTVAALKATISLTITLAVGMIFYYIELVVGQGDTGRATFINLLYFATITSTTVGYGDESPSTAPGRLIGSFYMLFAVVMFGVALSALADIPLSRRRDKMESKMVKQFGDSLSLLELQNIIRNANDDPADDSCSEAEFVISMMLKLDKVKPDQIKKLQQVFDDLDVDKSGTLSLRDVTETEDELLAQDD